MEFFSFDEEIERENLLEIFSWDISLINFAESTDFQLSLVSNLESVEDVDNIVEIFLIAVVNRTNSCNDFFL
jgi:hypothetical protein